MSENNTTNMIPNPVSKVSLAPVTPDIRINTLANLPIEDIVKDKDKLVRYVNRGLGGVTLLYDWAAHHLTVRVGYNTPLLSEGGTKLFAVFQSIVDDFSSDEGND
jgi:hypothetical protein